MTATAEEAIAACIDRVKGMATPTALSPSTSLGEAGAAAAGFATAAEILARLNARPHARDGEVSRSRAERARHRALRDVALCVPVRLRDGDECRFCGVTVDWAARRSLRSGSLHPLDGSAVLEIHAVAVACAACTAALQPGASLHHMVMPPPDRPEYSEATASYLSQHGRNVEAS